MPKAYPDKFKTEVIQRYRDGEPIRLLSQELHITQSTIYHWRKEYCSTKTHRYELFWFRNVFGPTRKLPQR